MQQAFTPLEKAAALLDERAPPERLAIAVAGTNAQGGLLERLPQCAPDLAATLHAREPSAALRTIDDGLQVRMADTASAGLSTGPQACQTP